MSKSVVKILFSLFSIFIATNALMAESSKGKPTRGTVKTQTGSPLRVRQAASTNSNQIGRLAEGTNVDISDTVGNWYKISGKDCDNDNSLNGYVYCKYITVVERNDEIPNKDEAIPYMESLLSIETEKRGASTLDVPLEELRQKNKNNPNPKSQVPDPKSLNPNSKDLESDPDHCGPAEATPITKTEFY